MLREEKTMLDATEVAALLGCKSWAAYKIIRECNKELQAAGKLVFRGKVNRRYLEKKLDVDDVQSVLSRRSSNEL